MTNLPAEQQKAVALRDYLQSDHIKNQLSAALPKWLSADRLLRVIFGAALKNPKILDCTRESILRSVMECAQLGMEPILGRVYLVPYWNGAKKALECQLQVGYQGLVDLARRSDTIADVWGANVYENDDFDLSWGMERRLTHRPWFMDPDKRKKGESGEIIGAYVVWQLKDGTKHPEFMPIADIHKRREKSQAWRFAETGDPKKGGGKRDSIWHQWPEEQNLKTVIKHSAKLVPSSIEFMQAVEADNVVEGNGFMPAGFAGAEQISEQVRSRTEEAAEGIKQRIKNQEADVSRETEPEQSNDWEAWAKGWWSMRSGKWDDERDRPRTGFGKYVLDRLDQFKAAPNPYFRDAVDKWNKLYPDKPCPFSDDEPAQAHTEARAEERSSENEALSDSGGEPEAPDKYPPEVVEDEPEVRGALQKQWANAKVKNGQGRIEKVLELAVERGHLRPGVTSTVDLTARECWDLLTILKDEQF